ncbi:MAG: hypothetical protein ACFFAI_08130 [Promethearchaeota archaeon]
MSLKQELSIFLSDFGVNDLVLKEDIEQNFSFTYHYGSFSWITYGNETSSKLYNEVILDFELDLGADLNDTEMKYIENSVFSCTDQFGIECIDLYDNFKNHSKIIIRDCSFTNQGEIDKNYLNNNLKNLLKCAKMINFNINYSVSKIYNSKLALDISDDCRRLYI